VKNKLWSVLMVLVLLALSSSALAQTDGSDPGEPTEPPPSDPVADLALTLSGPESDVLVGDAFSVTVAVTNSGPDSADDAYLYAYMGPEIAFEGVTTARPGDVCAWSEDGGSVAGPYEPGAGGGDSASGGGSGGSFSCSFAPLAASETSTLTLDFRRAEARPAYLSASVYSSASEHNYDDNYGYFELAPDTSRAADVALEMVAPKEVAVGSEFDYLLRVKNAGPMGAEVVTLTDWLPDGVELVTLPGACRVEDDGATTEDGTSGDVAPEPAYARQVTCDLGTIDAGATVELAITVRRVSGWEVWNSAWLSTVTYDPNYENDYSYAVLAADPSVSSDVSVSAGNLPVTPLVGETFDVTFTVRNNGPSTAPDVWLTDYLPEGLAYVSGNSSDPADSCGFTDHQYKTPTEYDAEPGAPSAGAEDASYPIVYGGGAFSCDMGALDPGSTETVQVTLERTTAREIWNYASVYSSHYDADYSNNYAETRLDPDRSMPADLGVKVSAPAEPAVGETFDYTFEITNLGPSVARSGFFVNDLPWGLDFVSASSDDTADTCSFEDYGYEGVQPADAPSFYAYRQVRCDLGDLEAGSTTTVTVKVVRATEWEVWNGGWITHSSFDENYENDYAYTVIGGENPYGGCKGVEETGGDDSIVTDVCPVEAGAGADQIDLQVSTESADRTISGGSGPDAIDVKLRTGSDVRRSIDVFAGRGDDRITVTVAPGAGDATIKIYAGGGDDEVLIDAASANRRLKIVVIGGSGGDSVRVIRYGGYPGSRGVVVKGGDGRDSMLGGNGADSILGGRGRDLLDGGAGNDKLDGGRARDVCRDGAGADQLSRC
jgi:uncharacterized repeat protein (TIGR01451 family)